MLTKPLRYENQHDAIMRLGNTLVRYKGKAVFVADINSAIECNLFYPRGDHIPVLVSANNVDLDITSPPLGFANIKYKDKISPNFLSRSPARQQSQGLHVSKIFWKRMSDGAFDHGLSEAGIYEGRAGWLADLIEDAPYPSIEWCSTQPEGAAFNRNWAIVRAKSDSPVFTLYHRMDDVGVFDSKSKKFLFAEDELTKTRRESINIIISREDNSVGGYTIHEQY